MQDKTLKMTKESSGNKLTEAQKKCIWKEENFISAITKTKKYKFKAFIAQTDEMKSHVCFVF